MEKDISHLIGKAKKHGLTFCKSTILFGKFNDNELIGFTGIILLKNKAIFKNHYVIHKHRGNGHLKDMLDFSLKYAAKRKINTIEATCTELSLLEYLKRGFIPIKKYKKYTKVRYDNL